MTMAARWTRTSVLVGCAIAAAGCAARSPSDDASRLSAADSIAAAALGERHVPGLALVVLRGDDTVLARGYGVAEVGGDAPVTERTVFQLGSISKQFLSALVVAFASEGMLRLDDPVARHIPDWPALPPSVRVKHLLSHTSGLREIFTEPEALAAYDDLSRDRASLHALVRRLPSDFAPGSRWSYSNTNYLALAMLVEHLTGVPYEDALVERFFRPLGLGSLRQCESIPRPPAEAQGHVRRGKQVVVAAPENMSWIRGDGGLCGNALDVARWFRLLATGRVIPANIWVDLVAHTRLDDDRTADYGFGLSLVELDGVRRIGHNGAMRGFSASAAYYPDSALTVVVLVNRGDVRTESIEHRIARRMLGLPQPEQREQPLSDGERARYTGTYDIGVFDVRVVDRDGRLWLEMPQPGPTTALRHVGAGEFVGVEDPDAHRVRFTMDGDASARELRLYMGAMHWYGRRRP